MSNKHFKVDFFIVGLPKSGTSALAQFLAEHPDICMSYPKEPGYFASDLIAESDTYHGRKAYMKARGIQEYMDMFRQREDKQILGDATPIYLYSKSAAKKIHAHNSDAKIIIILRHPIDFMHAMHMQYINDGTEDELDFSKAVGKEKYRKQGKQVSKYAVCPSLHFYKERAKYAKQIKRYLNYFKKDNVLILTHEHFRNDNSTTYKEVLRFLEVTTDHQPEFKKINSSQAPRSYKLHRFLNNLYLKNFLRKLLGPQKYTKLKQTAARATMKPTQRPNIDQHLKSNLESELLPDIRKLSRLLDKDMAALWSIGDKK